jgi:RNA polymerase sigma factor (sigma-70 family)
MDLSDKDVLREFAARPSLVGYQPFLERYLRLVYCSAYRQTGNEADAVDATEAVFLALARRLRSFRRKTVLVGWLFEATGLAARKLKRLRKRRGSAASSGAALLEGDGINAVWLRLGPLLEPCLRRVRAKNRNAVVLLYLLSWSSGEAARALHLSQKRTEKRGARGLHQLLNALRKRKLLIETDALTAALIEGATARPVPAGVAGRILSAAEPCFRRRPKVALARGVLRGMTWAKWKRRFKVLGVIAGGFIALLAVLAISVALLWRNGTLLPWLIEFGARHQRSHTPELAQPVRPWPEAPQVVVPSATTIKTAEELYRTTNIWLVHLRFSPEQWKALGPNRVRPVSSIFQPDGTIVLRNPKAQRNGVAGALGFDFPWAHADVEFSGVTLTNVGARLRGNGTFLGSLSTGKRPYKLSLDKFEKQQELAGIRTLDFLNITEDRSYMSDALGYVVFRYAGVPAPRTTYAWLTLTVPGQRDHKPLGLYGLVENVDAQFAAERFGSKKVPIFKPVTPDLFNDLGADWSAYAPIYDLKTKATAAQKQRVIDFSRLLTHADDAEFNRRVGEFLDLEEFARFLAALVLVANYDSFLTYGQNYYMFLEPRTDRFGFIPWDLDQAWGSFPQFGTSAERERASIWHPWVGRNRLLERVLAVEEFRALYRQQLDRILRTTFSPESLYGRIDEIAGVLRSPLAAESAFRLRLFDQAISTNWLSGPRDGGDGPTRPVHQIKRFIVNRARSVRDQLDGRSKGMLLQANGWQ